MNEIAVGNTPISYNGDTCSYKYLELPNGLKAILIKEKESIWGVSNSEDKNSVDEQEELCMSSSSKSISSEVEKEMNIEADLASVEGKVCLTFQCGSVHDAGYLPGIGDLCRQLIQFYNLDRSVVPTSTIDVDQTTFYHMRYGIELDSYLKCLAQIMRKPKIEKKHIRQFITKPLQSDDSYFKNTNGHDDFQLTNDPEIYMIYKWHKLFKNISPCASKYLSVDAAMKSDKEIGDLVDKFWEEFYTPRKASIVIKSYNSSLELMEKLVTKHFGSLKNSEELTHLNDNDVMMKLAKVPLSCHKWMEFHGTAKETERDKHTLLISWILPPEYWKAYMAKPCFYMSWVLNHQGRKSPTEILYKKDWITNILAGCNYSSYHRNSLSTLFQIRLELTNKGLEQKDEVLACIFTAIKNVGINKDIFEQVKLSANMSFRKFDWESLPYECYRYPSMNLRNLVHISSAISKFPLEHLITGELTFGDFDSNSLVLENFRKLLVPELADYILISPNAREPNAVEKYFDTSFFQEDIKESLLNKWKSQSKLLDMQQWKVPKLNFYDEGSSVFIAPLKRTSYSPKKLPIEKNDFYEIWHKQDPRTKEMIVIAIHLISSVVRRRPINEVLCELMARFLDKCFMSELFNTTHANYQCKCEVTVCGIIITVMGPRFQMSSVVSTALNVYTSLQKFIDESSLSCNRIYTNIQDSLNKKVQDETEIVDDVIYSLLIRNHNSIQNKYTAVTTNPLDISNFKRFVTNFQKSIYAYFYIQGNFNESEAETFVKSDIADKIFTYKNPINLKKTLIKSILWPVSSSIETNVIRVDTVSSWTKYPICQIHFNCGYADASNVALAKIHMDLLLEALRQIEYELPFKFQPDMRVVHGVLDVYFTIDVDENCMDINQNVLELQSLRSKLITKIDLFFYNWYDGFRKSLSDSMIMDSIAICKNDHYNYVNNLWLREEVSYFLEKIKLLDFSFSVLEEEERLFSKFEFELAVPKHLRRNDSVRQWIKEKLVCEIPAGECTRKLYFFLQQSDRPLSFDYKKANPYDLIKFPIEDSTLGVKYIDNVQAFKRKCATIHSVESNFVEDEEEEDEDSENEEVEMEDAKLLS